MAAPTATVRHGGASRSASPAAFGQGQQLGAAYASLCRFQVARVPCAVAVTAALAAGRPLAAMAAAALVLASCSIACARNDLADLEADRVNERWERPLAAGRLPLSAVGRVTRVAATVIVAAQLALPQPDGLVVTAVAAVIAIASAVEPVALQRRGVLGLLALGLGYFALPVALGGGVGLLASAWPLALLGAAVVGHKDVRDEPGDRATGKATVVVRRGVRSMARRMAILGASGGLALTVTMGPGPWSATAAVTVGALAAMGARGHTPRRWTTAKLGMFATALLVALALASPLPA